MSRSKNLPVIYFKRSNRLEIRLSNIARSALNDIKRIAPGYIGCSDSDLIHYALASFLMDTCTTWEGGPRLNCSEDVMKYITAEPRPGSL